MSYSWIGGMLLATLFLAVTPLPTVVTTQPGNDALIRRQPRFIIEATDMRVIDETGVNFLGADEIRVVFEAAGQEMFTGVYSGLDVGETRAFLSGNRCMWPAEDTDGQRNGSWSCFPAGGTGPVTVTVSLYEEDFISGIGGAFCIRPEANDVDRFSSFDLTDSCMAEDNCSLLSRHRMSFSQNDLVTSMPRAGDTHTNKIRIDNCSEQITILGETCGTSTLALGYFAYDVSYRITRMADEIIEPPVIR